MPNGPLPGAPRTQQPAPSVRAKRGCRAPLQQGVSLPHRHPTIPAFAHPVFQLLPQTRSNVDTRDAWGLSHTNWSRVSLHSALGSSCCCRNCWWHRASCDEAHDHVGVCVTNTIDSTAIPSVAQPVLAASRTSSCPRPHSPTWDTSSASKSMPGLAWRCAVDWPQHCLPNTAQPACRQEPTDAAQG